jgi:fused signal recognition particle receptor
MVEEQQKSGWWGTALGKLKTAVSRTKANLVDPLVDGDDAQAGGSAAGADGGGSTGAVLSKTARARAVDEDYLAEVEEKLIKADVGITTAEALVDHMRREALSKLWNSHDVEAFLKREFHSMLDSGAKSTLHIADDQLSIVLIVGVNGTGKTTSIGKLCWRLKQQGKKVLIAAGDTFRAAAETQLEIWAERAGVDIVRLPDGSDPGAVVFKAIERARAEKYDVLIIDTAGRLHNKVNLMAELKKIRGVIDKNATGCSLEALLVVDASVGQNGLQQAKLFAEACPLTGVILSKLDGSAKGGIVFSITKDLNLPIKLVGLGEQIDDLRDFEPPVFVEALFSK